MDTKFITYFLIFIFITISCRENSQNPQDFELDTTSSDIALILCEGLWGYNNSIISKLNLRTLQIVNDFTSLVNINFKIGDTANDILIKGDTFFVVVTTSKALEYFDLKTGKLLGYITFEGNSAPRRMTFVNDTLVAITDLYLDCVYIVNISQRRVQQSIKVGPAPEFVEYYDKKLFVANSGYGDYRANEPKASTISVVDINLGKEVETIQVSPNPIEILIDKERNRLYVAYNHLPSIKDSIGGIIMFELNSLRKLREWKVRCRGLFLDETSGDVYFITDSTASVLRQSDGTLTEMVKNRAKFENWYSVAYDWKRNILLVGNAKNYAIEGEILVFGLDKAEPYLKSKLPVGVNPSEIIIKY